MTYENERRPRTAEAARSLRRDKISVANATDIAPQPVLRVSGYCELDLRDLPPTSWARCALMAEHMPRGTTLHVKVGAFAPTIEVVGQLRSVAVRRNLHLVVVGEADAVKRWMGTLQDGYGEALL